MVSQLRFMVIRESKCPSVAHHPIPGRSTAETDNLTHEHAVGVVVDFVRQQLLSTEAATNPPIRLQLWLPTSFCQIIRFAFRLGHRPSIIRHCKCFQPFSGHTGIFISRIAFVSRTLLAWHSSLRQNCPVSYSQCRDERARIGVSCFNSSRRELL